ncbi:hypothetical protein DV952_13205, partial [Staphylococcus pseudintermedius]|uniref:ATP-binding protein n=1 Tax=Staphylococcus pseudintermedius TaxID=283734 RepID=UPI000E36F212
YLTGKEIEVEAISDGETVMIPGIMEHIDRASVQSGDSIAVYPPQTVIQDVIAALEASTVNMAKGLKVIGFINIKFVLAPVSNTHRTLPSIFSV